MAEQNVSTYNNLDVLEQFRALRKEILDGNIKFDEVSLDQVFAGLLASVSELNMVCGVLSPIQDQINNKISGYEIKGSVNSKDELDLLDKSTLKTGYAYTVITDNTHGDKHTLYKFNAVIQDFEYYGVFETKIGDTGLTEDQKNIIEKLIITGIGDKLLANDGKYKDIDTILKTLLDDITSSKNKTYSSFKIDDKLTKLASTITSIETIKGLINTSNSELSTSMTDQINNSALEAVRTSNQYTDDRVDSIDLFAIKEVSALPSVDISPTTIYLIHKGEDATLNKLYEKWIFVNGKWELFSVTSETSDFVSVDDFNSTIANFITERNFKDLSEDDVDYMVEDIFTRASLNPQA